MEEINISKYQRKGIDYIFLMYKIYIDKILSKQRDIITNCTTDISSINKSIKEFNKTLFEEDKVFKSYQDNLNHLRKVLHKPNLSKDNHSSLNFLVGLYTIKINKQKELSKARTRISTIHKRIIGKSEFAFILNLYNTEMTKKMLKGKAEYKLNTLGALIIESVDNDLVNRKGIDWETTLMYKEQLLNQGKQLYSKDNPDGVKYFIHHGYHKYDCFINWKRPRYVKRTHRFIPTLYVSYVRKNIDDYTTIDGILSSSLGFATKLHRLCNLDKDYHKLFKEKQIYKKEIEDGDI